MLRYRVAALLLPFFLFAPAVHGELRSFQWTYVVAVLALFGCYIVATSVNDVFDIEVDRLNHPRAMDRPLVTGAATSRQLIVLAFVVGAGSLLLATALGPLGLAV